MTGSLLDGIVDKDTGNLLNRKGERIEPVKAEAQAKMAGAGGSAGLKIAIAAIVLAASVAVIAWQVSGADGGVRPLNPVAGMSDVASNKAGLPKHLR